MEDENVSDSSGNRYLSALRKEVVGFLRGEDVSVFLFGSRARGDAGQGSDIDIAVVPHERFDRSKLIMLREMVGELNVPYNVDVVDFSDVSEQFRVEALKGAEVWKDCRCSRRSLRSTSKKSGRNGNQEDGKFGRREEISNSQF